MRRIAAPIVDLTNGIQRIEINIIRVSLAPQAGMADKFKDILEEVL